MALILIILFFPHVYVHTTLH